MSLRHVFELRVNWARTYQERDAAMAYDLPVALLLMAPTWLVLTCVAFAGLFGRLDRWTGMPLSPSAARHSLPWASRWTILGPTCRSLL